MQNPTPTYEYGELSFARYILQSVNYQVSIIAGAFVGELTSTSSSKTVRELRHDTTAYIYILKPRHRESRRKIPQGSKPSINHEPVANRLGH